MATLRLFERFAQLDASQQKNATLSNNNIVASVHTHLSQLVNTARGSVLTDANYGVADFAASIAGAQAPDLPAVAKDILAAIEHYEPRLTEPKVKVDVNHQDNLSIRFSIIGNVEEFDKKQEYTFSGTILANGKLLFEPRD